MGLYESLRIDASSEGKRFGAWTQLGPSFSLHAPTRRERAAVYECECGAVCVTWIHNVISGKSKGCITCRSKKVGDMCRRHGMSRTRVHNIWWGIITRCTNPNVKCWKDYGGRGISVCERWKTFENFYEDMGEPPTNKHEIDRKDPNGHYEPDNCRWATAIQQGRSRRSVRHFMYEGKIRSLPEISEMVGKNPKMVYCRIYRGWSLERAISE